MPGASGILVASWPPEIDVMEVIGLDQQEQGILSMAPPLLA
jgi:hypothetical protein